MTSFTTAVPGHQPPSQSHRSFQPQNLDSDLWARLAQPGVLVSVLALACTIAYQVAQSQAAARDCQLPTFVELLWNSAVHLIPARVLYAIDRWVNAPLFPLPMLQPLPTTHVAKSDLLHRILRSDQPGGIVASMSQAGRRAYTTFASKNDSCQPAGLGNWDNSCFQNSIIQGLSSLRHLPPYLAALKPGPSLAQDDTSTTVGALRAFVYELTDPSNNGKTLYTPGILKNMSTLTQQDAQEYFSILLERVDEDIKKGSKAAYKPSGLEADLARDDSVASQHSDDSGYQSLPLPAKVGSELVTIRNPLEGLSTQRVACTACGYSEGLSMTPFNCTTLMFDAGVGCYTLDQLLDKYVQLEFISDVDCTKCTVLAYRQGLEKLAKAVPMAAERLQIVERILEEEGFDEETLKKLRMPEFKKVKSTKTKQVAFARPPPSLAIHMNRSVFDPASCMTYKNLAAVQFPPVLDMGPWCIGSAQGAQVPTSVPENGDGSPQEEWHKEQWMMDATASMVAGGRHESQISGPVYELRAVITHYGRHENGHYVCYRKHPRRSSEVLKRPEAEGSAGQSPTPAAKESSNDVDNTEDLEQKLTSDATLARTDGPYAHTMDSQWWRLSDETVIQVSEEEVLAQGGVFMLLYDCVDPNSVLVASANTANTAGAKQPNPVTEHGRNSPSRSEESAITVRNVFADRDNNVAQTSLVTDFDMRDGRDGAAQISVTELVEEEHPAASNESKAMADNIMIQGTQEMKDYDPINYTGRNMSEASSVTIDWSDSGTTSRRSSVTLATDDDWPGSALVDDNDITDLDEPPTQPKNIVA